MVLIQTYPISLNGHSVIAIEVKLPKTNLLMITTEAGYIMCGALDVGLLNQRLKDRGIIAGRAVGVRTIEELLNAPLESVTHKAEQIGIVEGMNGRDALILLLQYELEQSNVQ